MGAWLATIVGLGLIALVLRDLYVTLFDPRGSAAPSATLQRGVRRAVQRVTRRPEMLAVAGPPAMVATMAAWTFSDRR